MKDLKYCSSIGLITNPFEVSSKITFTPLLMPYLVLSLLGINNWKATETKWDKDILIIKGEYEDREKNKVFFEERHYFEKDRRIILLLSSLEKQNWLDEKFLSFFDVARNWEQKK